MIQATYPRQLSKLDLGSTVIELTNIIDTIDADKELAKARLSRLRNKIYNAHLDNI